MIPALLRGLLKEATKENGLIRSNVVEVAIILTVAFILSGPSKKKEDSMAVKTSAVVLKDGREGRGVKVTARNYLDVANWGPDGAQALAKVNVNKGSDTDHRVKLHTKAGIRVARVGDTVVKLAKDDYIVIKADQFAELVSI